MPLSYAGNELTCSGLQKLSDQLASCCLARGPSGWVEPVVVRNGHQPFQCLYLVGLNREEKKKKKAKY